MRAKILSASAGSGKTYRLAYKYVRDVVENPSSYRNILAVTFTNKATEEMKSRILSEIDRLASGKRSNYTLDLCRELNLDEHTVRLRAGEARANILHDYSRFTVLTIDTFFQRILRAFIRELGIDLNYTVELDTAPVLTKSADALVEEITVNSELQQWLTDFMHERIDDSKRWDIREGILGLGSELFKERNKEPIRNAGSKEELKKIVKSASRRAADSQKRIAELGRTARKMMDEAGVTEDDFARNTVSFFRNVAENPKKEPTKTARACAESSDKWFAKKHDSPAAHAMAGRLSDMMAEICAIHDRDVRLWNTAELLAENYRSFALLADLYAKVTAFCEEENTMLLSETKYVLSQFIADNDAPFIYEKTGARFDRFMIDEFQDTSLKEWENFLPLLQNAMSQSDQTSVLLVGDVKQSIYRWRGGDWKILQNTAPEALGNDTDIESLRANYRSLPVIVGFNNRTIGKTVEIDNAILNAELDAACADGKIRATLRDELRDTLAEAYADHAQTPMKKAEYDGYVDISIFDDEPPIVERIKSLLDKGFRPKDIMILTRDKNSGVKVAERLLAFKHDNTEPRHAFDVMTQEALIIGSSPVVKFVVAVLSLALNPDDAVERAVFRRFSGAASFESPLTDEESDFLRSIRLLSPEAAFERTVMHFGLDDKPEQTAYLQALHEQIVRFCIGKVADIRLFLKWWNETGHSRSLSVEQSETTIEITTIHKAKGLEKKVIIIPYCDWRLDPKASNGMMRSFIWSQPQGDDEISGIGAFPVSTKKSMGDSLFAADYYREKVYSHVDSINLLYVALTRAVESLHIFIPRPSKTNDQPDTAGKLVLAALPEKEFSQGNDGCMHLEFGEFVPPCRDGKPQSPAEHETIRRYRTSEADMRLRLPSQRYFEDETQAELSPRNFGILMHMAFAHAESADDIGLAVKQMTRDAVITEAEAERLTREIDKALSNPVVHGWFDKGWTEVRNENDIIVPHGAAARRPDRVMIKGRRATVVDYKFGEEKREKYGKQLREYMQLLREMGYTDIEGYIWYVKLGQVERVPA